MYLMKKCVILSVTLAFLGISITYSQTFSKRLILTDKPDSGLVNAESMTFDANGNYCFDVKKNGVEFLHTKDGEIGTCRYIGATFGTYGSVKYTYEESDAIEKKWYYQNAKGTKVYGPIVGRIKKFIDSDTKENIGLIVENGDSLYFYINDKAVGAVLKDSTQNYDFSEWCAFSENGNCIYYTKQNGTETLFVNGKPIKSASSEFYGLGINNNGQYIFTEGMYPKDKSDYDYMFYIHSPDTILGPVRTVWNYYFKDNGVYYFSGDDNGSSYIAINNHIYKNIRDISNIILINKTQYFFTCTQKQIAKAICNGNIYDYSFDEIYQTAMDTTGNFAFFGLKDYYLYKFINGIKDPTPLSKNGVRAMPIYINPKGSSIHYFKTDDSTYIYQDDKLLFSPMSNKRNFFVEPYSEVIEEHFIKGRPQNANDLSYMELDTTGYFVYNGTFSRPMKPATKSSYSPVKPIGEIIAGSFTDKGFFAIQKTGNDTFTVNINNKIYQQIDGFQTIIPDCCYFTGNKLIFYGISGLSFYQFVLEL
jgi:hypothetical protein